MEYVLVNGTQEEKPLEVDTVSSPSTVYLRKNIKGIEAVGNPEDENYVPKHWQYEERAMTTGEYFNYQMAMKQAEEINRHSDQEAIDNYTRQLMDEGVI